MSKCFPTTSSRTLKIYFLVISDTVVSKIKKNLNFSGSVVQVVGVGRMYLCSNSSCGTKEYSTSNSWFCYIKGRNGRSGRWSEILSLQLQTFCIACPHELQWVVK